MESSLGSPLSMPSLIFPKNLCRWCFGKWRECCNRADCYCLHFTLGTKSFTRMSCGVGLLNGFLLFSAISNPTLYRGRGACNWGDHRARALSPGSGVPKPKGVHFCTEAGLLGTTLICFSTGVVSRGIHHRQFANQAESRITVEQTFRKSGVTS